MEEGALKDGGKELDGHGGGLIVMEKGTGGMSSWGWKYGMRGQWIAVEEREVASGRAVLRWERWRQSAAECRDRREMSEA